MTFRVDASRDELEKELGYLDGVDMFISQMRYGGKLKRHSIFLRKWLLKQIEGRKK